MARDNKGFVCHSHTSMVSYEIHHVWPKEYGGPNTKDNKAKICPNAHSDIHYLMDQVLADKPWNWREYGPGVRAIAARGIAAIRAHPKALERWRRAYAEGRTGSHPPP